MNFGELDTGSPIDEVRRGSAAIARAYARQGASERFSTYIEDGAGHTLSSGMWGRARAWFERWLRCP